MNYANPADMPARSEEEQLAFFEQAWAVSEDALAAVGLVEHDMIVAGRRIRLCFAGNALASLTMQTIAPLCQPVSGDPDARFLLWDSASAGRPMPAPPLSNLCFSQRGDLWTFRSRRVRSAFHYWDYSLNLFDRERRIGIFWLQDAGKLPGWTRAAPFRTLFHWFLADEGLQLVHGAVVGTEDGAVLISGPGGVGKSTSALSALAHGMHFAGDDYVVLSSDGSPDAPVHAHMLYASAKVHFPDAPRFVALGHVMDERTPRTADDKAVIYPSHGLAPSMPLRAVVTPRFGVGAESGFEPVASDRLVMAGAFPTLTQLPHSGLETIAFVEDVVRRVPGGMLVLGQARERVPDALRWLLRDPGRAFGGSDGAAMPGDRLTPAARVSVILPAFNAARHIGDAIDSILAQTHRPVELIVVDDGSTDGTAAVVAAKSGPIRLIRQENAGPAAARNRGIREARGEYLCFQDADDLWPAWKISAALAAFADDPAREVVIGRSQLFEVANDNAMAFVASPMDTFPWSIAAAVFRRSVFDRVGRFDPLLRFGEDTDWFDRAEHVGAMVHRLDDIALYVRRHESNSTKGRSVQEIYPVRLMHNRLKRRRQNMQIRSGSVSVNAAE